MAQVVLPTTFIDGQVLPVDDLNKALYSKTPGEGVYSEPNGGIQLQSTQNGGTDFKLRQEHLQPEQVVKTRTASVEIGTVLEALSRDEPTPRVGFKPN